MSKAIIKSKSEHEGEIISLEREIHQLENDIQTAEQEVNNFEAEIRAKLQFKILKMRQLGDIYKTQRVEKKKKRLEQKRKGKNYIEPKGIKKTKAIDGEKSLDKKTKEDLRKLYKEAIVRVHPDKFVNDDILKSDRATEITIKLNAIYKSGNIEALNLFHEHIISGNAMSHKVFAPESVIETKSMLKFLRKKKAELVESLKITKQSYTYHVLKNYAEPMKFLSELEIQFDERIEQLQKRTKH